MDAAPRPPVSPTTLRCVSCKYDLSGTAVGGVCPECGTPVESTIEAKTSRPPPPPSFGLAWASLVLGVLGLCAWPLAPIALALAFAAQKHMKRVEYPEGAKTAAMLGVVLGFLGTFILFINIVGAFVP